MTQFLEWNLKILTYLAEHRSEILTTVLAILTYLGSEYVMIGLISLIFLCFNKKAAYRIALSFFGSGAIVQIVKLTCRIERPWTLVQNDFPQYQGRFSVADKFGAKSGATGYSFPSGHSQSAAAVYGALASSFKKRFWLKIALWALVGVVMFSRIYLGVHTLFDVVVGLAIGLLVLFMINAIFEKIYNDPKYDLPVSIILAAISAAAIVVAVVVKNTVPGVDQAMISDCLKASACGIGFAIGYFVERRFIRFDPKVGTVGEKIFRFVVSFAGILALKEGIKYLGKLIFKAELPAVDVARYLLIMLFGLCLVPWIVTKLHKKSKDERGKDRKNVRKRRNKMQKKSKKANYRK